ncbi:MAG: phosphoglycerate mutase (2,3-diphosphoglycerate-independent) [Candidatus Buchananbacteria bacterium RIFCSPLOWO2_01_FULL_46_12]|uniref:2,3-bisphosphoglycerate-independent phosphoglycerate mutase n=2 Tax=Candidatus Buchananiibacteriota TaxID=1817903 RepID=A0A1G1YN65_9BACT|nr:MAG: phosphoglycerate mutase (2,3-diphosphoglycerate-independent) [Candidatus Buchananbacteria bacterium RIFCSPHIGHO2_01_FULL_44_11]OGY53802.1 MAG: phosphoglycerate mutase (2,3-diphosphoglycerate-independent) [Candidatus Buchananbacteria bacterium RIFCSPLOWO2_01_FULL_46_12]
MPTSKKINNKKHKPFVLLILDGWGLAPKSPANAIEKAKKPVFDELWKNYPHTKLKASGRAAGLPDEQPGNSEAGHMNIGAGRIVDQDSVVINKEINTGRFFKNPAFEAACSHLVKNNSSLHLVGLLSNGVSPHSNPDHLLALLVWSRLKKIKNVYLHLFTDGRDSPPHASLKLVESLIRSLKNKETAGRLTGEWVATIMGRFYAMDRKKEWSRTEAAYNAMVLGQGIYIKSPQAAITQAYNRGETDEFIKPYVIKRGGKPIGKISDNDAVIFFNLRSDRARQMAKPFVQADFNDSNLNSFKRKKILKNLVFIALTDFGPDLGKILTAYPSIDLQNTLPMVINGRRQLYIAEAEKYAHVTYFFNGGYADPVASEDRIMVPSAKVSSYDQAPAMSIYKITNQVVKLLSRYEFICINFAIPDMVAHSGNLKATVEAVEHIDRCLTKLKKAVNRAGGTLLITSDHGNGDKMLDLETGEMYTEHTANPVPFILVDAKHKKRQLKNSGKLGDIAPTILKLMKIKKPKEMTGKSLL